MALTATTVALASLAIAAVGTGVGAYSAVAVGEAQQEAADLEAAQMERNSQIAADQAQYEAQQIRKRNQIIRGRQAAVAAKSGLDLSSGTFLDVVLDSTLMGEMDVMAALYSGKITGGAQKFGAQVARKRGATAQTAGYFNAGSTVLSGAGSMLGKYGDYRRAKGDVSF